MDAKAAYRALFNRGVHIDIRSLCRIELHSAVGQGELKMPVHKRRIQVDAPSLPFGISIQHNVGDSFLQREVDGGRVGSRQAVTGRYSVNKSLQTRNLLDVIVAVAKGEGKQIVETNTGVELLTLVSLHVEEGKVVVDSVDV